MRNFIHVISTYIIFAVFCACFFIAGYFYHTPETIIKEVEVVKTVDKLVYRDYSKVNCCELLQNYDKTPIQITYNVNEMKKTYTNIDVTWRLYERQGIENINVPVYQSGNWKLYAGIGIGAVAVGGISYAGYKILR